MDYGGASEHPPSSLRLPRMRSNVSAAFLALVLAVPWALSGCDNPACVFGGDCSPGGSGGAVGTLAANVPEDGQILRTNVPRIDRFAPIGDAVDPKSPIVIVFSESISPATLSFAFELRQVQFGAIPLQASSLVGDGRVLVMFPLTDLMLGAAYQVAFREDVQVGDRTGQAIVQPSDRVVGSFTVAATAPTLPSVVLTYPDEAEVGLPDSSEIVVVFSRAMDAATVNDASFEVEVNGAPPPFDPPAQPLTVPGFGTDTRVFRWRSLDDENQSASLGTDATVTLQLSPTTARIEDVDGNELPLQTTSFHTLPFSAPLSATITSFPADAIGIDALVGPANLAVQVDLVDAIAGDELGVYIFGIQPEDVTAPRMVALFRAVTIVDPPGSFTFTAAELNLVLSTSPLAGRVRDGTIAMAFRVKRGDLESPVRMIDVDPLISGAQGPVLDTVAPVLIGMGAAGTTVGTFVSDQRDVVLVGKSSESLRGAFVTTPLGDNEFDPGNVPIVVGSDSETGVFMTAPVPLGILADTDEPLTYSMTIYDRALNLGGTATGTFVQRGAAASGLPRPFAQVAVEVYDARTLAPIVGAQVLAHEDDLGSLFVLGSFTTDVNGRALVDPALVGRTVVTVVHNGYDLFTFDGVPTDQVSIPLTPSAQAATTIGGTVTSVDPQVNAYQRRVADTRFPQPGETLFNVSTCSPDTNNQQFVCNFGPAPIRPREVGAITGMAVLAPSSLALWAAPTFLHGFGLRLPLADVVPGLAQTTRVSLDRLNIPGGIDEELIPLDVMPHALTTTAWPNLNGAPRIRVEGLVPGLRGPLTVGQGVAFLFGGPSSYAVRAAYPGLADPFEDDPRDQLGRLVTDGTLQADLFLRAEVLADSGARGIDRPRLSGTDNILIPPDPPAFGAVPLAVNPGGAAFDVSFVDVLRDADAQMGLHRVTLTDTAGRRWTVWRLDDPDAAGPETIAHLPVANIGDPFPLAGATVSGTTSSWSWTFFDPSLLLWSDVEREFERAAHSAIETLTVP